VNTKSHSSSPQNHNIKIANKSFENVAKLKYLGMTKSLNYFHAGEKIVTTQFRIFSSHLLSKNVKLGLSLLRKNTD
jgi:hypothetical protein